MTITYNVLLLCILNNQDALNVLLACEVNIDILEAELKEFISKNSTEKKDDAVEIQPTLSFQRVIQRAVFHVQSSGTGEVTGANVLVALFSEKESHSVYLLKKQGMTRLDAVSYMSHGEGVTEDESFSEQIEATQNLKCISCESYIFSDNPTFSFCIPCSDEMEDLAYKMEEE